MLEEMDSVGSVGGREEVENGVGNEGGDGEVEGEDGEE